MSSDLSLISEENVVLLNEMLEMARDGGAKMELTITESGVGLQMTRQETWTYDKTLAQAVESFKERMPKPSTLKASWSAEAMLALFEKAVAEHVILTVTADFRKSGGNVFKVQAESYKPFCRHKSLKKVAETAMAEALDKVLLFKATH